MEPLREQILILISTPLYLLLIGAEVLMSNAQHRKLYSWRDTAENVYLLLLNSFADLAFRAVYIVVLLYFFEQRIMMVSSPFFYWTLLLLLEDFIFYWLHRFDHEIRLFWAVHVTHHSSSLMNLTVGFRSSVFQPLYRFIYFIPLALLGFHPIDILLVYSATQIWGILVHTQYAPKLGWLEKILVTPSHHRVHHACNVRYLDKNMGMFLIIWDKIFGTFQKELAEQDYEQIRYGLTSPVSMPDPVHLVFHEWKAIFADLRRKDISLQQRFLYLFGPPGWSHDGTRKTSAELRQQEKITDEAVMESNKEHAQWQLSVTSLPDES